MVRNYIFITTQRLDLRQTSILLFRITTTYSWISDHLSYSFSIILRSVGNDKKALIIMLLFDWRSPQFGGQAELFLSPWGLKIKKARHGSAGAWKDRLRRGLVGAFAQVFGHVRRDFGEVDVPGFGARHVDVVVRFPLFRKFHFRQSDRALGDRMVVDDDVD